MTFITEFHWIMHYDSSVYCFLVPAPATTFSLRFGKQSWNGVAGAGTRLLFYYLEYFGSLLSCNECSEMRPLGRTINEIMRPEQNLCVFYAGRTPKWITASQRHFNSKKSFHGEKLKNWQILSVFLLFFYINWINLICNELFRRKIVWFDSAL